MSKNCALTRFKARHPYTRPKFARMVDPHLHSVKYSICGHLFSNYIFIKGEGADAGKCCCRRIDPVKLSFNSKEQIIRRITERVIHGRCSPCNQQTEELLERLRLEEDRENDMAILARVAASAGDFGWEELTEDWVPVLEEKKGGI
ncbi:hypothetical protein TWF106_005344 [Orbilia oligospora]|uniref:Uncharacterized protein n=1 Tax=Orbilia oligospora TaxID=2813651 RepID=A0A6G1M5J0_ORBOL|nr:hypothetical protein TWF191_008947 [Orbilia oligospora]KAF3222916.1 hypothetical protein TWF106_005344 [Orbilia oligospora]KAF3246342.1 hypothetical protein TWF192_006854 [Orbilia oligospora]